MAAKYLARTESKVVGLVGAGVQARTQLLGLSRIFKIERVIVADRSIESAKIFAEYAKTVLDCDIHLTTDAKEACDCDVLVTATPARAPVVRKEWVKPRDAHKRHRRGMPKASKSWSPRLDGQCRRRGG